MNARGFSLVELLIALTVTALIVGAVAGVLPAARAAFDATPGVVDLQQRSRLVADVLSSSLRGAGGHTVAESGGAPLSSVLPVILPLPSSGGSAEAFSAVVVTSAVPGGGQGVLERDQTGPAGALTLATARSCPHVEDVCGFRPGAVAAIVDGRGRYDVFVVASTNASFARIVPAMPLSTAYLADAALVEIESTRFALAAQADGSSALVKQTADGPTQPIVDGVSQLSFDVWAIAEAPILRGDDGAAWASYGPAAPPATSVEPSGTWPAGESCVVARDESGPRSRLVSLGDAGSLVRLPPSALEDGPWCPGAAGVPRFDADAFRVRRLDITFRVEVLSAVLRGPAGRLFARGGLASHAPIRWVPDRVVALSVAVRSVP